MSRNNLFYGFIVLTVVCLLCAIYYAIPGINHVFAPHNPTAIQIKHIAGFVGIAVVCALVALVNRPKSGSTEAPASTPENAQTNA